MNWPGDSDTRMPVNPHYPARSRQDARLFWTTAQADAEPHLLEGFAGPQMHQADIGKFRERRLTEAAERLVKLYEAWEKPAQPSHWRMALAEVQEAN